MVAQELRVMVGIPASGKSTFAKMQAEQLKKENKTVSIISRDTVRFSMLKEDEDYFVHEEEVFDEFIRQINEAIKKGTDVVFADATHISVGSRRKLLSKLTPNPNTDLIFQVIDVHVAECLNRNAKREGRERVPNKAIQNMARGFKKPSETELPHSYGFQDIIIEVYAIKG